MDTTRTTSANWTPSGCLSGVPLTLGRPLHGGGEQLHSPTGTLLCRRYISWLTSDISMDSRVSTLHLGYNSALEWFLCSNCSSVGCWELLFSRCISLSYPIFVGLFFFLAFPPFWYWKIPQAHLGGSLSQPWNRPFLQGVWFLYWRMNGLRNQDLGGHVLLPSGPSWPTEQDMRVSTLHTRTLQILLCVTWLHIALHLSPHWCPSSISYPRALTPRSPATSPPALRLSAPTRHLCVPGHAQQGPCC